MEIKKVPGGLHVDGLVLKHGRCGCTSILACCLSWSKVKKSGNNIVFTAKATGPGIKDNFTWSYTVRKEDVTVEVRFEDARDKEIFSGYYPPRLEEWLGAGWELVVKESGREDFGLMRCAACKWLYKEQAEDVSFKDLPEDWVCPVCGAGKRAFEQVA